MIRLTELFDIAGYCRISVDEEMDRENTSIENQKAIIQDFVAKKFPGSALRFYEDRDRSGYTFEQRESYQKMRLLLMGHRHDMLIVKDFSRFARRNSRGLVELEDLRDQGVRIISIGDSIDYPTYDDWTAIQFRFLINEMPVTDASKKVKSVIQRRQADGKWICAVPYGYLLRSGKTMELAVDEAAAQVVRLIFARYLDGWGYRKIANHLTDLHLPTPRMGEKRRKEALGEENRIRAKAVWSIATIQGILENDFYVGTLRQGKYTRKKINGADLKKERGDHIIFVNHHPPIVEPRTFAAAAEQHKLRSTNGYRGVKKYDNTYSGLLFCGDCGSPLFSMSRGDLKAAYTCGAYHRRGLSGCTSHHTRADVLDRLLRSYLRLVREHAGDLLERLNAALKNEAEAVRTGEETAVLLQHQAEAAFDELKATKRQRVRDLVQHPEREGVLDQTYDAIEAELVDKIVGLKNQIALTAAQRGTLVQVNRAARTAVELFDGILQKDRLDKGDLTLIVEKIVVYEARLDILLKADIDALLQCGTMNAGGPQPEEPVNFTHDTVGILQTRIVQSIAKRKDKVYGVNVISKGDPLEIYTDKEGGVIFKKYSLMGGLSDFAVQMCETLYKTTGRIAVITDRDTCIAVAGTARRELCDKRVSSELESIMEGRQLFQQKEGDEPLPICEEEGKYLISAAAPVLSEGDVLGCVLFAAAPGDVPTGEVESKLVQTIAGFLGKHMES